MSFHPLSWLKRHVAQEGASVTQSPREQLGPLFETIQKSRVFPDSKTFADSIPKKDLKVIKAAYESDPSHSGSLLEFVQQHFTIPEYVMNTDAVPEPSNLRAYIDQSWNVLKRPPDHVRFGSLIPLPHRYVVPGGRFREIYYWDSYFTMLGLHESGQTELLEDMVANFAYLIHKNGFIPNANRTYQMSRSQPPFFSYMVRLLAEIRGDAVYETHRKGLVAEYQFWMRGAESAQFKLRRSNQSEHVVRMPGGEILNRYYDSLDDARDESFFEDTALWEKAEHRKDLYRNMRSAAESGWDFSSRWFAPEGALESTRVLDVVPVDLNCLLLELESTIATAFSHSGDTKNADMFIAKRDARARALQRYCWNEDAGLFVDYILPEKKQSDALTLAGVFPLFTGVATAQQAARIAETLKNHFLRDGGLVTTFVKSGEQWDSPNGWAPLQYVAIIGLERYGFHDLAQEIASRWCALVAQHFEQDRTVLEKYDVENTSVRATGGEYELQQGFGWTNGVTLFLMNKYKIEA
jgi:alpha,alpha-trehalase